MNKLSLKFYLIVAATALLPMGKSVAQSSLTASIDSTLLLIGEQTKIHVVLNTDKAKPAQILLNSDTIMKGVEILEISKPDTIEQGNRLEIKQDYLVTSFDSGLYYIPPFKAALALDTFASNPLALKVMTIPFDTVSVDMMRDIKGVMSPPIVWMDYLSTILYICLIILLLVGGFFLYRYIRNRKIEKVEIEPELLLPPYVAALQALERIKQEKLWQQGREKEYFTEITDALRNYIDRQYGVDAPEMTSDEIVGAMVDEKCPKESISKLKSVLKLADLVKFAKFKPLPDENDLTIIQARAFVEETKPEEQPAMAESTNQENETSEVKNN